MRGYSLPALRQKTVNPKTENGETQPVKLGTRVPLKSALRNGLSAVVCGEDVAKTALARVENLRGKRWVPAWFWDTK